MNEEYFHNEGSESKDSPWNGEDIVRAGGGESGFADTEPLPEWAKPNGGADKGRRSFLSRATRLFVAGAVPVTVTKLYGEKVVDQTINKEEAERRIGAMLEKIRSVYGIEVDFSDISPTEKDANVDGETISWNTEKLETCEAILEALMLFPPSVYKKGAELTTIRVSNDLAVYKNRGASAVTWKGGGRIHLENHESGTHDLHLYIKGIAKDLIGTRGLRKEKIRWEFHHELFHLIDETDEGEWDKDARGIGLSGDHTLTEEDLLSRLYLNELQKLVASKSIAPDVASAHMDSLQGFVREYGKSSPLEDRATIAEWLFIYPAKLERKMKSDEVLRNKVDFVRKEYFKISRGIINEHYWEMLRKDANNPELMAEFLRQQAQLLLRMSPEMLEDYFARRGVTLTRDDLLSWRQDIATGVEMPEHNRGVR